MKRYILSNTSHVNSVFFRVMTFERHAQPNVFRNNSEVLRNYKFSLFLKIPKLECLEYCLLLGPAMGKMP